jgi:hypothetical protein
MAELVHKKISGLLLPKCERCATRRARTELRDGERSLGRFCDRCGALEKARYERNPLGLTRHTDRNE